MKKRILAKLFSRLFYPEYSFLLLGPIFGFLFVFITPPFQTPDEPAHFYRTYELAEGKGFVPKMYEGRPGNFLPRSLKYLADNLLGDIAAHPENKINMGKIITNLVVPLRQDDRVFTEYTILCSPVAYTPQVLAIVSAKLMRFPPLGFMYLARLFNLIIWIILVYIAVRIVPVGKWLFVFLALTPMSIFMAASMSPDVFTNAASFLFIALCLKLSLDEGIAGISWKHSIILISLAVMLAMSKFVYFSILFLFFLIPVRKFKSKLFFVFTASGIIFIPLFLNFFWALMVKGLPLIALEGGDPGKQFFYILLHPLKYIVVLIITSIRHLFYMRSFIGILGWFDTHLPKTILITYPVLLFFLSVFVVNKRKQFALRHRVFLSVIAIVTYVLVMTVFYLLSPLRANTILSVSGRYFIPISPVVFLLFYNISGLRYSVDENNKKLSIFFFVYTFVCLFWTVIVLINRFYA